MLCTLALTLALNLGRAPRVQATEPASAHVVSDPQAELLQLAFDSVSAMPEVPHLRNRNRAQESIVQACLELDLPDRAQRYALAITDWRKAQALADIALHQARKERTEAARATLILAEQAVRDLQATQEWQAERVMAHLAAACYWLGDTEAVAKLTARVGEAEIQTVQVVVASRSTPEQFDQRMELLSTAVKSGSFDAMAASLQTAAELHRTLYSDAPRRERAEALIKSSWEKLPLDVRAGLLRRLADNALAAGDAAGATRQLDEAQALVDNNRWLSEDHIAQIAQIARLRAAAGERERAQRDLAGVLGLYERERDKITDIYRADALRPVAEALVALGDRQAALATFARAVDEGLANPNSRPRADDLAEIACSIARSKLVPDAELTARLRKAQAGLGDPW
jgi:hypothetical protein